MKRSSIKKKELRRILFCFSPLLIFPLIHYSESLNNIIAIGVLIVSGIFIYKSWNDTCLLVLSVFLGYCNYSIVMGVYLDASLRPKALYPQITDVDVYGIGISMIFIFMLCLALRTKKVKRRNEQSFATRFIRTENKCSIIFAFCWIVFHFIIIEGYQTSANSRGRTSPLYEYGVIFLIMMFYYSGFEKYKKLFCAESAILYSLVSLLNGTRVEALICIIIFILCFFKQGIKHSLLFPGIIGGLIVFSIVGNIRGNWLLLHGNFLGFVSEIARQKFVFNTCTHAFFPALCMINTFKSFSFTTGFYYFTRFMLTIIMGQLRVPDGDLISVVGKMYYHNYGGVTPGFFYVWFSYFGSIILGFLVLFYINIGTSNKKRMSDYRLCAFLFFVASSPRWFLYGPWSLTRGVLICLLVFFGLRVFYIATIKKRKKNKTIKNI